MTERALTAGQKTLIDLGPLVVFFAINYFYGIMIGTAALMAAQVQIGLYSGGSPSPLVFCFAIFSCAKLFKENEK